MTTPACRVLVIADDARLRELLSKALHRRSMEVLAVSTGNELVPVLEELSAAGEAAQWADVILLDVPAGPDPLALRVLHQLQAHAISLPMVCLTAPADVGALAERGTARTPVWVVKPIDIAELSAELRRAAG
jgi:DNA-binding response OmpR family regulator